MCRKNGGSRSHPAKPTVWVCSILSYALLFRDAWKIEGRKPDWGCACVGLSIWPWLYLYVCVCLHVICNCVSVSLYIYAFAYACIYVCLCKKCLPLPVLCVVLCLCMCSYVCSFLYVSLSVCVFVSICESALCLSFSASSGECEFACIPNLSAPSVALSDITCWTLARPMPSLSPPSIFLFFQPLTPNHLLKCLFCMQSLVKRWRKGAPYDLSLFSWIILNPLWPAGVSGFPSLHIWGAKGREGLSLVLKKNSWCGHRHAQCTHTHTHTTERENEREKKISRSLLYWDKLFASVAMATRPLLPRKITKKRWWHWGWIGWFLSLLFFFWKRSFYSKNRPWDPLPLSCIALLGT